MLSILVLIAIWVPVGLMATGVLPTSQNTGGEESISTTAQDNQLEQPAEETEGTAAEDVVSSSSTEGSEYLSSSAESSSAASSIYPPAADLAWRDTDFVADMTRHTDWNFEPNGRKVVYLTIDDGPSARTQEVLDILDKYNCKATFFVTGTDPAHYYQIAEEYKRGHTVGLHTYSHDYAYVYSSTAAYWEDLTAIANVVRDQIGYIPCFIRFPGGSSNGISANYSSGIMSILVNEVTASGYQYYDWNASTGDGSEHTAEELYQYACEFDDQENVVLLCHDSEGKASTVEALPRIIEHYQELGYTFEAIDRTTMVPHHEVAN